MTWRDRLQAGSFRGAPFLIQESRGAFGRRNKTHEYPGRDTPWNEDLGKAADRWSIDCLVVGDDYDTARDALIKALKAKGWGTLIHPYLGSVRASVDGTFQVSDSTSSGGMATFSIQFVEAGSDTAPAATVDTQSAAKAAAAKVQAAAKLSAASRLHVLGLPGFVQSAATGLLATAKGAITQALSFVTPAVNLVFGVEQQLQALVTGGLALLAAPASLVSSLFAGVQGIANLSTFAEDALTQLVGPTGAVTGQTHGLIGFGTDLPPVPTATPSTKAQAANQAVLTQLVQCAAAAAAVSVVSDMDFTSYDDAVGIRDPLADQLDTLAIAVADAGDDALASSIDDLRVAMIQDVSARGATLARLYRYSPVSTEPALVIAQRLYGDATRADEIIDRNTLTQPLFVAGGLALEVLSAS